VEIRILPWVDAPADSFLAATATAESGTSGRTPLQAMDAVGTQLAERDFSIGEKEGRENKD